MPREELDGAGASAIGCNQVNLRVDNRIKSGDDNAQGFKPDFL